MNAAAENLSGFWVGRYDYAEGFGKSVSFLANVTDESGALTGMISEPNQMGDSSRELHAIISGSREGNDVFFIKTYDGASDAAHRVDYAGTVNGEATLITGHWILAGASGHFEMRRTVLDADMEQIERAEDVPVHAG